MLNVKTIMRSNAKIKLSWSGRAYCKHFKQIETTISVKFSRFRERFIHFNTAASQPDITVPTYFFVKNTKERGRSHSTIKITSVFMNPFFPLYKR